jgi:hypothetical protein
MVKKFFLALRMAEERGDEKIAEMTGKEGNMMKRFFDSLQSLRMTRKE